jgi:chemotaxis protein methyltransferase CheR
MNPSDYSNVGEANYYKATLSDSEFNKLSKFIVEQYGIKMPPVKRIMLQSRLQKRLKALQLDNFKDYIKYVFSEGGQSEEIIHMMDVVSTNKTDFFREPVHFDFLLSEALHKLAQMSRHIKIWSAGCSSGEEPYTIAMTLSEFKRQHSGTDFEIIATDISTKMLQKAVNAIYTEDKTAELPLSIKTKYFLRSKNKEEKKVRVIPDIRHKVKFYRLNLMELPNFSKEIYHIIFCRNVLIYFDRETQYNILQKMCNRLSKGGYLFLGHSESITGFDLPLKHLKPTIFEKI